MSTPHARSVCPCSLVVNTDKWQVRLDDRNAVAAGCDPV